MQDKLLLIDGHSLLFRAFYGMPLSMTAPDGVHTNAVYGFLAILRKVLEEEKPQYLAIAFDKAAPTFRHKMFEAYKGTRSAAPPEFHEQVPLMKEILAAMDIVTIEQEGWEADDILGPLARRFEAAGGIVSIVSGDRDLLQIATDRTEIIIPKTKGGTTTYERYHTAEVIETMGVTPLEFIDMKALMGDSSDNIPGLPGVGPKTAGKIIQTYHSIENAYAHVEEITPKKAQTAMREHYDLAVLSKDLATIRTDAPVEAAIDDLKLGDLYNEKAYELYRRLGFKSLLGSFETKKAAAAPVKAAQELTTVRDIAEAEEAFASATSALENDDTPFGPAFSLAAEDGRLYALALTVQDRTWVFLPEGFLTEGFLADKLASLVSSAASSGKVLPCLSAKEAAACLKLETADGLFDCTLAAYLMNPLKSDWDYDDIAALIPGQTTQGREELIGKKGIAAFILKTGEEEAEGPITILAAQMAQTAAAAAPILREELRGADMLPLFENMEMPLTAVLAAMEREGIGASREALAAYGDMLGARIDELTAAIYEEAGETFNINSPKQLAVILFEKMKLPGGKKTKTGYSTAADVLEKLAEDHPIVRHILEYRTYSKLKSTYADGLQNYIREDGRIHTTFNQTITATGRLSSTEPNLQNIPMREDLGRQIRKCFFPKEGCVFVDADYSQIELRVLAHMSGDEKLIEAYNKAQDIHRTTASQVFHVPFDEVTPQMRSNAKAVNFGIIYGQTSFGLSQGLSISRQEAAEYIRQYFETYPKIKSFLDGLVREAKEKGYAVSVFGRRRPVPELKAANFMQRSFGERVAMNSPIQGTAADIIKLAMIRVYRRLREEGMASRLILQIHDELLIESPREEAEKAREILIEEMKAAASLRVALETDCHIAEDWYGAK